MAHSEIVRFIVIDLWLYLSTVEQVTLKLTFPFCVIYLLGLSTVLRLSKEVSSSISLPSGDVVALFCFLIILLYVVKNNNRRRGRTSNRDAPRIDTLLLMDDPPLRTRSQPKRSQERSQQIKNNLLLMQYWRGTTRWFKRDTGLDHNRPYNFDNGPLPTRMVHNTTNHSH